MTDEQHAKNLESARLLEQWQAEGTDEEVSAWQKFEAGLKPGTYRDAKGNVILVGEVELDGRSLAELLRRDG